VGEEKPAQLTDERPEELPDEALPWVDLAPSVQVDHPVASFYLSYLVDRPDSIVASLRHIGEADGATLVHCAAGKDRTGLVIALALSVAGADREVVAADYATTGDRLAPYVDAYLATIEDEEQREFWRGHQATPVEFMLDVLEHLEVEHGGVEAYLRSGGMTDEQLSALRERLVA